MGSGYYGSDCNGLVWDTGCQDDTQDSEGVPKTVAHELRREG